MFLFGLNSKAEGKRFITNIHIEKKGACIVYERRKFWIKSDAGLQVRPADIGKEMFLDLRAGA